jgi:hypothetical protein
MTGLSASDLSAAMMLGPNVFAIATSVALLSIGLPILMFTAGLSALIVSIAVVAILAAAIHIIAVALGDALGQRVNALVVGGLFATVLVLPGFIGTLLVLTDATATGMLLGPLPAVVTVTAGLSGLPFAELAAAGGAGEFGTSIFSYSLVAHAALAFVCVGSWRRRVEQAWSALFRPAEGVLLSIVAVGCGTFVVLDLCERVNVRSYDQVNAITFVASLFLLPVLGWLLYSSLVRPARASAVAEVTSVRAAFLRFQGFLAIAALALGGAYGLVLERSGFDHGHELMWATLATGLLAVETAVATILLSARKRSGRHRVLILGALVVAAQLGAALGVYQIESLFISSTNSPANPLLIGMDASPYWLILLVLLWATGLGLILAAVLRERDRGEVERTDNEEEENGKRSRVLH